MSEEKEIKFPLSKRQRTKFENDYELIFFKKPVHNISDEKLVEAVQANQSKIGSNAKNSQQQPPQEGTKTKAVKTETPKVFKEQTTQTLEQMKPKK